jgi:hypothetical protein
VEEPGLVLVGSGLLSGAARPRAEVEVVVVAAPLLGVLRRWTQRGWPPVLRCFAICCSLLLPAGVVVVAVANVLGLAAAAGQPRVVAEEEPAEAIERLMMAPEARQ